MRNPILAAAMKKEFIKRWKLAVETYCKDSSNEAAAATMSVIEKKRMIKQTAAIAMAATKGGTTAWSRAIIDPQSSPRYMICSKQKVVTRRKKLMRTCRRTRSFFCRSMKVAGGVKEARASSLAKSIVKKKTQLLKRLLPGGEAIMDECCLIEEALDYIVSLEAQVDVMKELVDVAEYLNKP